MTEEAPVCLPEKSTKPFRLDEGDSTVVVSVMLPLMLDVDDGVEESRESIRNSRSNCCDVDDRVVFRIIRG